MEIWTYALLGLAPSVFWLWFIRHKDDFEPEPRHAVLWVFALGIGSGMLVLAVRPWLDGFLMDIEDMRRRHAADAFLVTAPLEEVAKAMAFLIGASWRKHLNEPLDGIVYGTAAGLGFASFENFHYLLWTQDASLIVPRAFTATLLHVGTTGTLGFCLGMCRFQPWAMLPLFSVCGLVSALGFHGLYNFFLFRGQSMAIVSLIVVLPALLVMLGLKIHWARVRSPDYHAGPQSLAKSRLPIRPRSGKLRLRRAGLESMSGRG